MKFKFNKKNYLILYLRNYLLKIKDILNFNIID